MNLIARFPRIALLLALAMPGSYAVAEQVLGCYPGCPWCSR